MITGLNKLARRAAVRLFEIGTKAPGAGHRDERMAVVVSGTWHFGCGDRFDAGALKTLPPGSIYSEPGGLTHFAQTTDEPVLVEISGFGSTDTRYFDPTNTPKTPRQGAPG